MNKQLHQALVSFLRREADENDVIALHNEHSHSDDYVYTSIEEIAEMVATDDDPTKIARMVYYGNVETWHDAYFCLNAYGNINSFYSLTATQSPIDFELLAKHIMENDQFSEVGFDAVPHLSDE